LRVKDDAAGDYFLLLPNLSQKTSQATFFSHSQSGSTVQFFSLQGDNKLDKKRQNKHSKKKIRTGLLSCHLSTPSIIFLYRGCEKTRLFFSFQSKKMNKE